MRERLRHLVVAIALLAAGCARVEPIQTVDNRPIATAGRTLTGDQVERAIVAAGLRRGWSFIRSEPGLLRGTHSSHGHTLVLEVPFDAMRYSIRVASSSNLRAGDGTIHRTANRWIRSLQQDIDAELARAAIAKA